jgi:hypothetical protein
LSPARRSELSDRHSRRRRQQTAGRISAPCAHQVTLKHDPFFQRSRAITTAEFSHLCVFASR